MTAIATKKIDYRTTKVMVRVPIRILSLLSLKFVNPIRAYTQNIWTTSLDILMN